MRKVLSLLLILSIMLSISFTAYSSENSSIRYTEDELIEGSNKLDGHWEELEIVQVGIRINEGKLYVACFNLNEEKKEKIRNISDIENIEFTEFGKEDFWSGADDIVTDDYLTDVISEYVCERKSIMFFPNSNIISIKDKNNEVTEVQLEETFSFVDRNGITYVNPEYIKYLLQEQYFNFHFNKNNSVGNLDINFLLDSDMSILFENYMLFKLNESVVKFADGSVNMVIAPIIKDNKMYLPLRAFLRSIGFKDNDIKYSSSDGCITIEKNSDFVKQVYKLFKGKNDSLLSMLYKDDEKECIVYDDIRIIGDNYEDIEKLIKDYFDEDFDIDNYAIIEPSEIYKYNELNLTPKDENLNFDYSVFIDSNNCLIRLIQKNNQY